MISPGNALPVRGMKFSRGAEDVSVAILTLKSARGSSREARHPASTLGFLSTLM
jgi:hypothetical protein